MQEPGTQNIMDYTTVSVGLVIKGQLWTGQPTACTAVCPECGRVGLISLSQKCGQIVVHSGRVDGNTLEGIDYCKLGFH